MQLWRRVGWKWGFESGKEQYFIKKLFPFCMSIENGKFCFKLNHSGKIQQMTNWLYFSYFSPENRLTFHTDCLLRRQFAWNVEACFLEKIRKIFEFVICWNVYLACWPLMQSYNCLHLVFMTVMVVHLKKCNRNSSVNCNPPFHCFIGNLILLLSEVFWIQGTFRPTTELHIHEVGNILS